jgi:hypothetical protein
VTTRELNIKVVRASDITRCPVRSLLPGHYRQDGTCRCKSRVDWLLAAAAVSAAVFLAASLISALALLGTV